MPRIQVHSTDQADAALALTQIVGAALALLDEVGYDGLTMRHLADKLDIKAASLYWHVRNKQDLLNLVADEICAFIAEPDRALPWQERLEALGHEYRRALLTHRDSARVLATASGPIGPNRLRLAEIVLATLRDAGLSDRDAAYTGLLVNDYVTMFVLQETQFENATQEEKNAAQEAQQWAQKLASGEYPNMLALGGYLANANVEERFRFGIEILRKGLEQQIADRE